MKNLITLSAFLFIATFGFSQLYIGGGIGNSFRNQEISNLQGEDFKLNDNSFGWRAYAGFGAKFLSLEAGYRDLGTIKDESSGVSLKSDISGWDAALRGKINIGPIYGFGKAGAFFYKNDYSVNSFSDKDNQTTFMWGLGAGLTLGKLGLGLSYESLHLASDNDLSQLLLDVSLQFGSE